MSELQSRVLSLDGRAGARIVAMVALRPDLFRFLVLDRLDAPRVHTLAAATAADIDPDAIEAIAVGLQHEDVLHFRSAVQDAQWAYESILETLSQMGRVSLSDRGLAGQS